MKDQLKHKLFNIDVKSIDEEARTIKFCFSDGDVDRMGEVVDQASWQTKNYEKNPIILFGHDPSDPSNVLGQGIALDLNQGGKSYVTAQFDDAETNPKADMVFRQLIKRTLRAVSAGFINHTFEWEDDVPVLKDNELLEISIVPIPANPRAIALGMKDGSISHKDAKYLLDAMHSESELIEKELAKEVPDLKEKDVEELKDQITQLTTLVSSVVETVSGLKTEVETLKPVEETEEEKAEREQAEQAEADRIAAEEAAKGGNGDQSGADEEGDDEEFDENAELTDELQAEIDAALAEAANSDE